MVLRYTKVMLGANIPTIIIIRNFVQTPALDVFSMGCLIFFVLTDGIHLFGNEHKRVKDENDIADYRENGSKLEELRGTIALCVCVCVHV